MKDEARAREVLRPLWQAVSDELDNIAGGMHANLEDAASALWGAFDDTGAAEPPPSSQDVERNIRVSIWNACRGGGMGQDMAIALITRAMAEPCMSRALSAMPQSTRPLPSREEVIRAVVEAVQTRVPPASRYAGEIGIVAADAILAFSPSPSNAGDEGRLREALESVRTWMMEHGHPRDCGVHKVSGCTCNRTAIASLIDEALATPAADSSEGVLHPSEQQEEEKP